MPLRLYINGQPADLEPTQVIAQTKQVNDLNSIENRQASYTNKFRLPKTAHNVKLLEYLTVTGNTSGVPYKKNECSLYADNGQCFIYRGWAVITDGGTHYEAAVYDGIIDLYKAIENKNLAELGLDELTHYKSTATVLASWSGSTPYRYILADYNGNIGNPATSEVNIDYLVPSVNVKYLWDKIFSRFGYGYSGSVFNTLQFTNLWMTYPKGVSNEETDQLVFDSDNFNYTATEQDQSRYLRFNQAAENLLAQAHDNAHFKVAEPGQYKISVSGTFHVITGINQQSQYRVFIAKNSENTLALNAVPQYYLSETMQSGKMFSKDLIIDLTPHESISIVLQKPGYMPRWWVPAGMVKVTLKKLNQEVDFTAALAEFPVRDFFTEVVHRFGLTMHKEKHDRHDAATNTYRPHYTFLTLQEQLQGAEAEDWSGKFNRKVKEAYMHGNYAQQNNMRYSYNDKESSHNDGHIDIDNVNLPETKDIIKSKIYSPELKKSDFFLRKSNVYKLWEKEAADEGQGIKYKPLDKRYYFLRSDLAASPGLVLKSPALSESQTVSYCQIESFAGLSFKDIISDYYNPARQIFNRAMIVTAEMMLTEADICNFDFRKLYYIKQLSNYFLVNKINNYIPGKPVQCELVRVQYTGLATGRPLLRITKVRVYGNVVTVWYDNTAGLQNFNLVAAYNATGQQYVTYAYGNPVHADLNVAGDYTLCLKAGEHLSNTVAITTGPDIDITITL